ncbi:Restriction endonuclease BglII [Roseovarius azorensis]|uniref:Restriction endonuclease BglII n=1 Tax=Roseovarius azorensis TaxID=1287727 RepID=A0A1H7WPE6_9RHOB|nr:BglII/BstYI family type II restriction endonuclease [Roseovarius azorensis]SEM22908.1 Restriction endonuclease BglII [Roseovarius azorensis]
MARRVEDAVFDEPALVRSQIGWSLAGRYSVTSYRSAAAVLAQRAPDELASILRILDGFTISRTEIRSPGGNRMSATTRFADLAAAEGFHQEVRIEADLLVKLREGKGDKAPEIDRILREDYIHNHLVDFWRGRVAFDYEWNSKDQTYDRDLYAFRSFFEAGVIDVGVIVTRELSQEFFQSLGYCLDKHGNETASTVAAKFGASTTGTHKLISRIAAGRSGGCPVLVFGILPGNITPE